MTTLFDWLLATFWGPEGDSKFKDDPSQIQWYTHISAIPTDMLQQELKNRAQAVRLSKKNKVRVEIKS